MTPAASTPDPDTCFEWVSRDVQQTLRLGEAIGQLAQAGDIIALDGELGAGKTQLVRGIAKGMRIDPNQVSSPTFVVVHEYEPDNPGDLVLVHIDAYRVQSLRDLESIGWETDEDMCRGAVVAIEWAQRLADDLGPRTLHIQLSHDQPGSRVLRLTPASDWCQRSSIVRDILDKMQA